ncbi:MAG: aspartate kinase [Anaerolineae bacterium]|nr:aspartate kinase [Anaerolineae bacterium]MDW8100590.1 aspartate kinase [Anaerolineae bacterium]
MRVLKFGGTSVGNADAFARVASIIERARAQDPQTVVVTSAMSGVTNSLIAAAKAAAEGNEQVYRDVRSELLARHQMVAGQLVPDGVARAALGRLFEEKLATFEQLCHSIAVLGELTARGLDVVSSLGERLAAPLLAAVLNARGIPAEPVDASEFIVTDDHFGSANPLMEPTRQRTRERLLPLIEQGVVPVVTGFIGATQNGITTTLGRGGSDYSAAIVGACLDAERVEIWTDVDGVLTADPRIVPTARTLPQLSYAEAAELAYFGAKVLHPKTILPAVEQDIPIYVLNTFNPDHPGTRIVRKADNTGHVVKAITAIKGLTLVTVEGRGMIGVPGIAARTFQAVASVGANVLMISQSSSEQSICFVIPQADTARVLEALRQAMAYELERRLIDSIHGEDGIVIVAVVGSAMKGTPGIAAKVFGALGDAGINVIAIAQGSSEANISLVVAQGDSDEAVRRIHAAFGLDKG